MGEHAAIMAAEWGVTREEQDELTVASHRNLAAAYDRGFLDDLVIPYLGLERDQNLRPDSSVEKLAKLKPVFGGENGTMTAGNSTPLSDGASTVLLASEEWAAEHDLPVLAYIIDAQTAAVDHVHAREGLLMAPAYAVPKLLDRNGLTLQDFDFYEIHEAFAAQVLCTLQGLGGPRLLPRAPRARRAARVRSTATKLNVRRRLARRRPPVRGDRRADRRRSGQGARREARRSRGLISICAAGGLGVTAIIRRQHERPLPATGEHPDRKIVSSRSACPRPVKLERYEPGRAGGERPRAARRGARRAPGWGRGQGPHGDRGRGRTRPLEQHVRTAAADAGIEARVWNAEPRPSETFKAPRVRRQRDRRFHRAARAVRAFLHPTIRRVRALRTA